MSQCVRSGRFVGFTFAIGRVIHDNRCWNVGEGIDGEGCKACAVVGNRRRHGDCTLPHKSPVDIDNLPLG